MSFNIWNNLDETAAFLGIDRLDSETNESFYNRIIKFGKWKYKTDYYTQVHSIPIQSGLDTYNIVSFSSASGSNYKCKIDWEYFTLENEIESIRVFIGNKECRLSKILDAIDSSRTFSYNLRNISDKSIYCDFLVRNSNIKKTEEAISSTRVRLNHSNIIKGSVKGIENVFLKNEVSSLSSLNKEGDYFIEYEIGYIEFIQSDFDYGMISYQYYDQSFYVESTDINLKPLNLLCKRGIGDDFINIIPYLLNKKVWG